MRIFLSHQSKDKPLVREFKRNLPPFLNTWLDEESLVWGDSPLQELESTIQSSVDFLIIFLDNEALSSRWVMQELDWAFQRESDLGRTFVLPIMLPKMEIGDLPAGFSSRLSLRLADFNNISIEALAKNASDNLFHLMTKSYSAIQFELPVDTLEAQRPVDVPDLEGTWRLSRVTDRGGIIDEGPFEITQNGKAIVGIHKDSVSNRIFRYSGFISSGQVVLTFEEEGGEGYIIGSMVFRIGSRRRRMSGRSLYWSHDDNKMDGEDYEAVRE